MFSKEKTMKNFNEITKELEHFFSFNDLKPDHDYIIKFDDDDRVIRINTSLGLEELSEQDVKTLPPMDTYEWLGKRNHLQLYTRPCGFDWEEWS